MTQNADYLNELGLLNRLQRSGFMFLGTGEQTVSQHMFRMLHIVFLLNRMSEHRVDELHLLHLVMFHDVPEARTGDHNYVNKRYVSENMEKLLDEGSTKWPHGQEIVSYIREFEARATPAAQLANDADQLELLVVLKEQSDIGNANANEWIPPLLARLKTEAGKKLAQEILETYWTDWWYHNKHDPHWVHGSRKPNE